MKRILLPLLGLLMLSGTYGYGQKYETAIGLRLGYPGAGLTIKHSFKEGYMEGILSSHYGGGLSIEGMYQWHWKIDQSLFPNDDLYWFAGGGGAFKSYRDNWGSYTAIALVGIIGLDYTLPSTPINFTIDYKPLYFMNYGGAFAGDNGALSVRYTF